MINFVQFTTTVQEEIVFKRFEDKDYQRVSRWLIQHGYKVKRVPNNIIAEVFSKAGSPDLYLYRPYLGSKGRNKPISVEYVESPKPADLDKGIIYLPEYFKIAVDKHESYLWAPRAVSSKPIMFNFSVAAEHLGVSESLIRLAHYSQKSIKSSQFFGGIVVFDEKDLIAWDLSRANDGRRRHVMPANLQLQAA